MPTGIWTGQGANMREVMGVSVCVAAMRVLTAGSAVAGEVTGNGKSLEPLSGNSICAYSGLNDDPEGLDPANGPAGRTQSFGQDVRMGFIDPREFNPSDAWNPNAGTEE